MKPALSRSSRVSPAARPCRSLRALGGSCVAALLHAVPAWAQSGGGTTIVVSQRTPYVESVVVLALCGAALFAVCRSSRRN